MTVGLEIFNDSLFKLIESNNKNLVVASSSSPSTVTNTVTQIGSSMLVVSYTGTQPLIATAATNKLMMLTTSISGSTWTWTFISGSAVGTAIPIWIFDVPPASSVRFGLEVFDASGNPTFLSYSKPLRVAGVMTGTAGTIGYTATGTYIAGRSYATIQGKFAGNVVIGLGSTLTTQALHGYGLGSYGGTGSVTLAMLEHSKSANGTYTSANESHFGDYQVIVADVTNF